MTSLIEAKKTGMCCAQPIFCRKSLVDCVAGRAAPESRGRTVKILLCFGSRREASDLVGMACKSQGPVVV